MKTGIKRRAFLQMAAAGSAFHFLGSNPFLFSGIVKQKSSLTSPGCRGTKVKVARIFMGTSHGLWPKPDMNFDAEMQFYKSEFAKLEDELSDVKFVVDEFFDGFTGVRFVAAIDLDRYYGAAFDRQAGQTEDALAVRLPAVLDDEHAARELVRRPDELARRAEMHPDLVCNFGLKLYHICTLF